MGDGGDVFRGGHVIEMTSLAIVGFSLNRNDRAFVAIDANLIDNLTHLELLSVEDYRTNYRGGVWADIS